MSLLNLLLFHEQNLNYQIGEFEFPEPGAMRGKTEKSSQNAVPRQTDKSQYDIDNGVQIPNSTVAEP